MAALDLYDLCREFLDACKEATDLTSGPSIERVYVSPGAPPWDCTQLTVHAGGPVVADTIPLQPALQPDHRIRETGRVLLIGMTATVIRCCVPVPTERGQNILFPAPADIEAVAAWTLEDVWAIWNHLRTQFKAGTLFPSPSGTREFMFDAAFPLLTEGGCAGWQIPVRVQLGGYTTV